MRRRASLSFHLRQPKTSRTACKHREQKFCSPIMTRNFFLCGGDKAKLIKMRVRAFFFMRRSMARFFSTVSPLARFTLASMHARARPMAARCLSARTLCRRRANAAAAANQQPHYRASSPLRQPLDGRRRRRRCRRCHRCPIANRHRARWPQPTSHYL